MSGEFHFCPQTYFIICGLFNGVTHPVEYRMVGWIWIMNWKGCGRNRLWPNLWYHPGIWQQVLRKLMKILNWHCQWPDWDSNRVLPKYNSKALLPEPACSMYCKQCKYNNYKHVHICTVFWLLIETTRNYKYCHLFVLEEHLLSFGSEPYTVRTDERRLLATETKLWQNYRWYK
jgi:hypothetical protein